MKTSYKPRILWVSSDPKIIYSFSQQSEVICTELAKRGYDIHFIADGYRGKPYLYKGFKIYPNPIVAEGNHFGNESVYREYIKRLKPDLMISLTNTWQVGFLTDGNFIKEFPWVHWTPSESETPYFELIKDEKKIPYYLALSDNSYKKLLPYQKNLAGRIYHAVNDQDFYPLLPEEKLKLRKKYKLPKDAFVVGMVCSAAARKQPFRLLDAFIKFSKNKKNTYLVWYSNFNSYKKNRVQFYNVKFLLKQFYAKWQKRIILIDSEKPLPAKTLNGIYNLFDIFALPTAGEGFGIPIAEAMLCKVPPAATNYSAIPELITPGCGWKIKVKDLIWGLLGPLDVQGALADVDDLARILEEAYKSPTKRKKYGESAYKRAKELFTVRTITDQWEVLIAKIFKQSKTRFKQLWNNGQPNSSSDPESFLDIKKWICFGYIKQKIWEGVIRITEEESDLSLLNARAYAFAKMKQYKKAEMCYRSILKLKPDDPKFTAELQNIIQKQKNEMSEIFAEIYKDDAWQGGSGVGSREDSTSEYRNLLEGFIKENNIKTVLDLGCGDWQFSKLIDWQGINYKGYDVVDSVIAKNFQYEKENISFEVKDFYGERDSLPPADLLIIKDVFQHWPNEYIMNFFPILKKYKYVLITNSVWKSDLFNKDIKLGGFRPLDIAQKPFNLKVKELLFTKYKVLVAGKYLNGQKKVYLYKNS